MLETCLQSQWAIVTQLLLIEQLTTIDFALEGAQRKRGRVALRRERFLRAQKPPKSIPWKDSDARRIPRGQAESWRFFAHHVGY